MSLIKAIGPIRWDSLVLRIVAVAGLFAIVAGLALGQQFFVPLALSVLLTFILSPVVGLLQRTRLSRKLSVLVTVVLAFGLLGAVSYFIVGQVMGLAGKLPEYRENIQAKLKSLNVPFSKAMDDVQGAVDQVKRRTERPPNTDPDTPKGSQEPVRVEVVERGGDAAKMVTGALGPVISLVGSAAVVILLVIFLLIYQNEIQDRLIRVAGGEHRVALATQTFGDAVQGVSRYLFLQVIVNVSFGIVFGFGLFVLGVPNALLWGFTAAVFRFIPYLGPVVAALLPVILSLAIFPGWGRPVLVGSFIVALELLLNNVIEPWVYGKRTGLSPFAIVLAATFWAWLWGPMGLLLSVPLTVCLMTIGKYVPGLGFIAITLGDEPALGPELQVYNRILRGNTAEAAELLEKQAQGKPLPEVYDSHLIPVLRLADEGRHQGRLDEERMDAVLASMTEIVDDLGDAAKVNHEEENAATGPKTTAAAVTVICLPASDKADELAGTMLAQVLSLDGYRADSSAFGRMTNEQVELVEKGGFDIVVLSVLTPSDLTKGRFLYKRLRRRLPRLPILIGMWGLKGDLKVLEEQLAPDGHAVFVAGMVQAQRVIQELAQTVILRRRGEEKFHPQSAA